MSGMERLDGVSVDAMASKLFYRVEVAATVRLMVY